MSVFDWDGQPLQDRYISLAVPGDREEHTTLVLPLSLGVSTRRLRFLIPIGRFGDFLEAHPRSVFVSYKAAELFWALADQLREARNDRGVRLLWNKASAGGLHDVRLLYRLYHLAYFGNFCQRRSLDELVSDFCKRDSQEVLAHISQSGADSAAFVADAVLRLYRRLRFHAVRLGKKRSYKKTIRRFGPLGLDLQVQGEIAVSKAARAGLRRHNGNLPEVREACCAVWRESSERLYRIPEAREAFEWDVAVVVRDNAGLPARNKGRLRNWLEQITPETPLPFHPPIVPPRNEHGEISLVPDAWGDQVLTAPGLRAWADLSAAASVLKALDPPDAGADYHVKPTYAVLPRLGSTKPNLSQYRRLVRRDAFEADPGHRLVIGRLQDLTLRCHAEVCERSGGQSQLGALFRYMADWEADTSEHLRENTNADSYAVLSIACRLRNWKKTVQGRPMTSMKRFYEIEQRQPTKLVRQKLEVRTLLDIVPRGFGSTQLRALVGSELGLKDQDAERLVTWFVDILPDMGWVVAVDDTFEIVRENLCCELSELRAVVLGHDGDTAEAALRNLVSGKTHSRGAFEKLREVCKNPRLSALLAEGKGSDALFKALFTRLTASPIGRIRSGLFFTKAQRAEHVDFAEDVMKVVLFGLVEAGYDLRAFAGDEFVIQVRRSDETETLKTTVAAEAKGAAATLFRVPEFVPPCLVDVRTSW